MPFLKNFPDDATQTAVFERWPELAKPLGQLAQQLLRDGPLPKEQAELIFAFTSGVNACQYCYNIHRHVAQNFGIAEHLFEALMDDIDSAPVDEKLKPVLRFVRKLTETPTKMVQADADAMFAAGWNDDEFQYAISICAAANYFNRILEGHGMKGDPSLWEQRGKLLTSCDYASVHAGVQKPTE